MRFDDVVAAGKTAAHPSVHEATTLLYYIIMTIITDY